MERELLSWEARIRETALFALDPALDAAAYAREKNRLITCLYQYAVLLDRENENYSLEIVESAENCIARFDPSKGDFLHYFNHTFRLERDRARGRERSRGVRIPEDKLRKLYRYYELAGHRGQSIDRTVVEKLADILEEDAERLCQELAKMANMANVPSITEDSEGQERDLFDLLPSGEKGAEEELADRAAALELLQVLERAFSARQERQKPLLSALLSARLAPVLSADPELMEAARQMAFFNPQICRRACLADRPLTAREIAAAMGRTEQSVSRTWHAFLASLPDR